MLLLTGAPGSGKTSSVLERVRESLRRGRSDFRLLAPTATMAEHLRNQVAREDFVFRPSLIGTLSKFLEPWAGDRPQISSASLNLLAGQTLRRLSLEAFAAVADFPGVRTSLAGLIEEVSSAGVGSERLGVALQSFSSWMTLPAAFAKVFAEVERGLLQRGLALHGQRLEEAARRIHREGLSGIHSVLLDGFFSLTEPELAVVEALAHHAEVVVTLPDWHGAEASRDALISMGFAEERRERRRPQPRVTLIEASSMDHEVEEIAARVLEESAAGRPFREIGIVVRSADPYVPILRTALSRFGIPARLYFANSLSDHSLARYVSGIVEALLAGWDYKRTLEALRMNASGIAVTAGMDRFDFLVRERIPGEGVGPLSALARDSRLRALLDSFADLGSLRDLRLAPLEWSSRLRPLTSLFRPPRPVEPATHEMTVVWRGYAEALKAFESVLEETGQAFGHQERIPLAEFWQEVKTALRLTNLRVPDHRRNVVHVLDVYEARQWELPVVFVCGLLEKQFPRYNPQDLILPDDTRRQLQRAGVRLRTSADKDRDEQFLFDFAVTRAVSGLYLSYPVFNQKGEGNLKSYCLEKVQVDARMIEPPGARRRRIRPYSSSAGRLTRPPVIRDPELREWLRSKHSSLSPTGIEDFLQCPFLYFARKTLALEGPPHRPSERLDLLVQGEVVHAVLHEWLRTRGPLEPVFEKAFERACRKAVVPPGYATEAVRLELLRNLRGSIVQIDLPGVTRSEGEKSFRLDLGDGLALRGRIDRIDYFAEGGALVIDYKYSRLAKIKDRVKAHEDKEGTRVQGGLYMLALERQLGYPVVGMLFAAIRGEAGWNGWHLPLPGLERIGVSCVPAILRDLIDSAESKSLRAAGEIREGRVAPKPADPQQCEYCDFRDICRVETVVRILAAGEVEE